MDGLTHRVGVLAAGNLDQAIKDWASSDKKLAKIIGLDDLLASIDAAIYSFVAANNFNAQFREAKDHDRKYPRKSEWEIRMVAKTFSLMAISESSTAD
ncbi:hypothetical protein GGP41_009125 [Bipolaris sorokiniana]|uniref:Uncharacterized protein n=1 Tax=Cochliobolus sativus TaxID=45130 RepID=A0A8H5ZEM1_COCSA|nr:hypothetical protein GGP41_009125 [Bipolaris sorokiniana]